MKNSEAQEILSTLDVNIQEFNSKPNNNFNIVRQKYTGSTLHGTRSTCQVASVINAARMVGYDVPDFQDEIIKDNRVPWNRITGGIAVTDAPLMENIYREYMGGVSIADFSIIRSIKEVFSVLIDGKSLAVSTGKNHSVAVARFYRVENSAFPVSIIADPINGKLHELDWLNILIHNKLQVDTYSISEVFVHTTFVVG